MKVICKAISRSVARSTQKTAADVMNREMSGLPEDSVSDDLEQRSSSLMIQSHGRKHEDERIPG